MYISICANTLMSLTYLPQEIGNVSALMIKPVISVQRTLNWIIYSWGLKNCRGKSHTLIPLKRLLNNGINEIMTLSEHFCNHKYRLDCRLFLFVFSSPRRYFQDQNSLYCCCVEWEEGENWDPPWNTLFIWVWIISDFMSVCVSVTRWLYWIF